MRNVLIDILKLIIMGSVCDRVGRCETCRKICDPKLHQCGYHRCDNCKEVVSDDGHECYVQYARQRVDTVPEMDGVICRTAKQNLNVYVVEHERRIKFFTTLKQWLLKLRMKMERQFVFLKLTMFRLKITV